MKLTDLIVNRIGTDKLLHFLVAGYGVSLVSPIGWIAMLIMTALLLILSFIKEIKLDVFADYYDILAAVCGMAVSWTVYGLLLLIL